LRLKYVKTVRAKGRAYNYFDTGKTVAGKKVWTRLPDQNDPSFYPSYAACLGHRNRSHVDEIKVPKLIDLFQRSPVFRALSPGTQRIYNIYLARLERLMPSAPVGQIRRSHMQRLMDGMSETPGAANLFIATAESMFKWAKRRDYVTENPCTGIEKHKLGEHKEWPDHILAAALHSDDDRVRLLTRMLFFTAQRLNDVLNMAWNHVEGNTISVRQQKTSKRLKIPLHPLLAEELARTPKRGIPIITTADGKRMSETVAREPLKAFVRSMGEKRVPHGLRKNAVNGLLEAGCTMAEVSAITGQSLQMVEHYARGRNQEAMAELAVAKWSVNGPGTFKR